MNNTTSLVDMMTADTQITELTQGLALLWVEGCAEEIRVLAELHRCVQAEAVAEAKTLH